MKLLYVLLLTSSLFSLSACKPDQDAGPALIVGRWQLNGVDCYCLPGQPLPNEAVEFKADGSVVYYRDNKEVSSGTYTFSTGKSPCSTDTVPVIQFKNTGAFPSGSPAYTIEPSELVIDYGSCVDSFRLTYRRD